MNIDELGHRAAACKHWRWMPGMYAEPLAFRVVWADDDSIGEADQISYLRERVPHIYPDLSDPATLGCLLALVREAWPKGEATTNIHANYSPERGHYREWTCYYCTGSDWRQTHASTEAEALVAALKAAPKVTP